MKRLIALTWKELLQLKRDHISMRLIVGIPLMQLIIFGYAINYDVKHLTTVVLDESRSRLRLLRHRRPRRFVRGAAAGRGLGAGGGRPGD